MSILQNCVVISHISEICEYHFYYQKVFIRKFREYQFEKQCRTLNFSGIRLEFRGEQINAGTVRKSKLHLLNGEEGI